MLISWKSERQRIPLSCDRLKFKTIRLSQIISRCFDIKSSINHLNRRRMGSFYSSMNKSEAKPSVAERRTVEDHFKYGLGEGVLCFHRRLLYSAKCVDRRRVENQKQYFIHYIGWNTKWDEWLPEDTLLEVNDHNRKLQLKLNNKYNKTTHSSHPSQNTTSHDKERAPNPTKSSSKRKISSQTLSLDRSNGSEDEAKGSDHKRRKSGQKKACLK